MQKKSVSIPPLKRGKFWDNIVTTASRVGSMHCLKRDEYIGMSLQQYGEWAQNEINRLLQYVKPGDFVLDIGANIGFHALSFARRAGPRGQVWAFEPDPINGLLLRLNILESGSEAVVTPFDMAVSDRNGLCKFRTYPISAAVNFGHSGVDDEEGAYTRFATMLDTLNIERPPALIKLDIEGHELRALKGMRDILRDARPVLSVEANDEAEKDEIAAYLAELGYDVYDFVTNAFNARNFSRRRTDVWKGTGYCSNLLAVVPGDHRAPDGLPLRRQALVWASTVTRVDAVMRAGALGEFNSVTTAPQYEIGWSAWKGLRTDIRRFVTGMLRTSLGRLDPARYGELVRVSLDYLGAEGLQAEGQALHEMLMAGIEVFDGAVCRARDNEAKAAAHDALGMRAHELEAALRQAEIDGAVVREQARALNVALSRAKLEADREVAKTRAAFAEHVAPDVAQALRGEIDAQRAMTRVIQQSLADRHAELQEGADKRLDLQARLLKAEQRMAQMLEAHRRDTDQAAQAVADWEKQQAESEEAFKRRLGERDAELAQMRADWERAKAECGKLRAQVDRYAIDLTAALAQARKADQTADKLNAALVEQRELAQSEIASVRAASDERLAPEAAEALRSEFEAAAGRIAELLEARSSESERAVLAEQMLAAAQSARDEAEVRLAAQASEIRRLRAIS